MKKGKFVVLEGGVGAGKSTQFEILKTNLGKNWRYYREPGGTDFGEKIRDAVQGLYDYKVDKYASLFAYTSSRANLVRTQIIPHLNSGKSVLLDRYWFSTYAYQGADGVDKKEIIQMSKFATNDLLPDLVIHLDQNPKVGIARKDGHEETDRFDLKELDFHNKVRKNYLDLASKHKKIWKVVDADREIKVVAEDVRGVIKNIL